VKCARPGCEHEIGSAFDQYGHPQTPVCQACWLEGRVVEPRWRNVGDGCGGSYYVADIPHETHWAGGSSIWAH